MQSATLLLTLVGCALAVPYGGGGGLVNTGHSAQYRHDDPAHGTYEFGYNEDHATGGTFRKEKGGPGYQVGSYGLRDADGRMRIVHYIADAHGFRVKISTNEEGVDVKQDPASTSLTSSVHHGGPIDHHLPAPVEVHAVAPIAENYYHQDENQHLPEHSSVHHQPEHHHQQHYNYIEQPVHYAQEEVHAEAPVHRISSPEIYKHQHSQYEPQNHHHHHLQHLTPEPLYSSPTHAEPLTFGQRISSGSSSGFPKASLLYSGVGGSGDQSHNYGPALGATLMASVYAGRGDADHHSHAAQSALPKSAYVPDEEASYGPAAAATAATATAAAEYSPTAGHYDQQNDGGGGGGDYQLRGNYY